MFTTFHYAGAAPKDVTVSLAPGHDNTFQSAVASTGDTLYLDVRADAADQVSGFTTHQCASRFAFLGPRLASTTSARL